YDRTPDGDARSHNPVPTRRVAMKRLTWLVTVFASLLTGVATGEDTRRESPPPKVTPDLTKVVQGNTAFALDLYGKLRGKDGNLFFSPYSISTALAMTYAGARGRTAEEMANTLRFTLEPKRLHPAFRDLAAFYRTGGDKPPYQLSVANALWVQKNYGLLPDFLNTTRTYYGVGVGECEFTRATE